MKLQRHLALGFLFLIGSASLTHAAVPIATETMKQELTRALSVAMATPEHAVVQNLYVELESSLTRQGFKKNGTVPSVELEAFHADAFRVDYTFRSVVRFLRECPQIPRCFSEEVSLTVEGVTLFAPTSEVPGYVIPSWVNSRFSRSFLKGGGASVGGPR